MRWLYEEVKSLRPRIESWVSRVRFSRHWFWGSRRSLQSAVLVGFLSESALWVVLAAATVVVIADLSLTTRSLLAEDDK